MALALGSKLVLGALLVGAAAYLGFSDTGDGVLQYVYVDELAKDLPRYTGRTIKVHGNVVEGSVLHRPGQDADWRFVIQRGDARLPVHYTNQVPDTFQEGGEVVLTGRLSADGASFESDEMSAKCPSKYEEEQRVAAGPAGASK
jgi:cytochrome c-type biogenesis protein CcmE